MSTIVFAITGVFVRGGGVGSSPPKDEEALKKIVKQMPSKDLLEALSAIVGSVFGTILSFLGKVV